MSKAKIKNMDPEVFKIAGKKIYRGERLKLFIEAAALYDHTMLSIPVEVIRGKSAGPTLFICAAIHGDEINGTEIVRRLLQKKFLKNIKGTLIIVPIVNVFGFNNKSRYLPDRRDLNRSFPGNKNGSLAKRLAYTFMKEIVSKSTHGIDIHTGAIHRENLPQIRACLEDGETKDLALKFGVPVVIDSKIRDGSLREAARKKNVKMLLLEAGQALRFDERSIKLGLKGCVLIMREIGMLRKETSAYSKSPQAFIAKSSYWVRASRSGILINARKVGETVKEGELLGRISNSFGDETEDLLSDVEGVLIGVSKLPLVNQGDAVFHIAVFKNTPKVKKALNEVDLTY